MELSSVGLFALVIFIILFVPFILLIIK
jgi:hypothetical protein